MKVCEMMQTLNSCTAGRNHGLGMYVCNVPKKLKPQKRNVSSIDGGRSSMK